MNLKRIAILALRFPHLRRPTLTKTTTIAVAAVNEKLLLKKSSMGAEAIGKRPMGTMIITKTTAPAMASATETTEIATAAATITIAAAATIKSIANAK